LSIADFGFAISEFRLLLFRISSFEFRVSIFDFRFSNFAFAFFQLRLSSLRHPPFPPRPATAPWKRRAVGELSARGDRFSRRRDDLYLDPQEFTAPLRQSMELPWAVKDQPATPQEAGSATPVRQLTDCGFSRPLRRDSAPVGHGQRRAAGPDNGTCATR